MVERAACFVLFIMEDRRIKNQMMVVNNQFIVMLFLFLSDPFYIFFRIALSNMEDSFRGTFIYFGCMTGIQSP